MLLVFTHTLTTVIDKDLWPWPLHQRSHYLYLQKNNTIKGRQFLPQNKRKQTTLYIHTYILFCPPLPPQPSPRRKAGQNVACLFRGTPPHTHTHTHSLSLIHWRCPHAHLVRHHFMSHQPTNQHKLTPPPLLILILRPLLFILPKHLCLLPETHHH